MVKQKPTISESGFGYILDREKFSITGLLILILLIPSSSEN
mgnify:CR=1 FL=1